jgi:hypothetical protein
MVAYIGGVKAVEELVHNGAYVHAKDGDGLTALQ